jgi:hypothetical protein
MPTSGLWSVKPWKAHLLPPLGASMPVAVGQPAHRQCVHQVYLLSPTRLIASSGEWHAGQTTRTLPSATSSPACLLGASRRQVATTPPSPTAANRSPLGAQRTDAARPQLASLRQVSGPDAATGELEAWLPQT